MSHQPIFPRFKNIQPGNSSAFIGRQEIILLHAAMFGPICINRVTFTIELKRK
jgi:hypothetical protein